jgi:hypothetical protein
MRSFVAGFFMAASLAMSSPAFAQRDGADRTQRLDSEEFRNDMSLERLKRPSTPLFGQPAPTPNPEDKPAPAKKKK